MENSLNFSDSVTNIIMIKTGECYYVLESLSIGCPKKDQTKDQTKKYPILYFRHAITNQRYEHVFNNNKVFSDKYVFVTWDKIDKKTQITMGNKRPHWQEELKQVATETHENKRDTLDKRIINMGIECGTHKNPFQTEKGLDVDLTGFASSISNATIFDRFFFNL